MKNNILFDYPVGSKFDDKEINIIKKILKNKETLTRGDRVNKFERDFKNLIGCKFAISTNSGSSALELSSKVLNLKKGDNVICQSNSYWTCISHLLKYKIKIKCCDITQNLSINTEHLLSLIDNKTKAIYIFHHGGNVIDVNKIKNKLNKKITIIEDCAHSLGSKINNQFIGKYSDIACFSFSTHKNISTLGEGGMIATNNKFFYKKFIDLKDSKCIADTYKVKNSNKILNLTKNSYLTPIGNNLKIDYKKIIETGSNFRLSAIQAAVGSVQLKKLKKLNAYRNKIAKIYINILSKCDKVKIIYPIKNSYSSYHLFSFLLKNLSIKQREYLANFLLKYRINCKIRFSPINWYPAMRYNGCKIGGCESCQKLSKVETVWIKELFSLPISASLKLKDAFYIAKKVFLFLNKI